MIHKAVGIKYLIKYLVATVTTEWL